MPQWLELLIFSLASFGLAYLFFVLTTRCVSLNLNDSVFRFGMGFAMAIVHLALFKICLETNHLSDPRDSVTTVEFVIPLAIFWRLAYRASQRTNHQSLESRKEAKV